MKVLLLVLLTFQWTKNTCGLQQLVFENNNYLSDDTVVLDGAGVGSSANEHESHILFPNNAEITLPLTKDTTLTTYRITTRLTTKTKTIPTSERSTLLTTEVNTRLTTKETILLATKKTVLPTTEKTVLPTTERTVLPTTEKTVLPTTAKTSLPTTGIITLPTTGKITLPTTGNITMRANKDITLRTTDDNSLPTTEETTLTTTEAPTSSTTEFSIVSTIATTTIPLTAAFRDCGAIGSHIKSGRLNYVKFQCSGVNIHRYCMLQRNTTARIFLNLTSNVDSTKVKTIVHAHMNGVSYPFMFFRHLVIDDGAEGLRFLGIEEDACLHKNVDHCNIKSGEVIQYSNAAFIDPRYPLLRMVIQLEIRDDQDRDLACVRFPVETVN